MENEITSTKIELEKKEKDLSRLNPDVLISICTEKFVEIDRVLSHCLFQNMAVVDRNIIVAIEGAKTNLQANAEKFLKMKRAIDLACIELDRRNFAKPLQQIGANLVDLRHALSAVQELINVLKKRISGSENTFWERFGFSVVEKLSELSHVLEDFITQFQPDFFHSAGLTIFFTERCLLHCTGSHPECANRLRWVMDGLKQNVVADAVLEYWTGVKYVYSERIANKFELCLGHSPDYVAKILAIMERMPDACKLFMSYRSSGSELPPIRPQVSNAVHAMISKMRFEVEPLYMYDVDTAISRGTNEASLAAVGCVLEAVDAVLNFQSMQAFCAIRPPGHHAGMQGKTPQSYSSGFCLFNNAAIGALYSNVRVLLFDFDVHHGNGTQEILSNRENVAFISTHVVGSGFYPNTGYQEGDATNVLNIPLRLDFTPEHYMKTFYEKIVPFIVKFKPELIMISAGFDARAGDLMLSDPAPKKEPAEIKDFANSAMASDTPTIDSSLLDNGVLHTINNEISIDPILGKRKFDEVKETDLPKLDAMDTQMAAFFGLDEDDDDDDEDFTEADALRDEQAALLADQEEDAKSEDSFDGLPSEFKTNIKSFIGLSAQNYYDISFELGQLARQFCHGRIVSVLEGGYGEEHFAECVQMHLLGMQFGAKAVIKKVY